AEECLEKIAEPGPAELKFDTTVFPTAPVKSTAALPATPLRRRLKPAGLIPILAQLIVFPPLFRIAQDFVGFVNLFKFFLRLFLILRDIRMIFTREFSKGAFDFLLTGRCRTANVIVILAKLDRHCR